MGDGPAIVDWYSNHPTNYAGDATTASAEKGNTLFEGRAKCLAGIVARIKGDQRVPDAPIP